MALKVSLQSRHIILIESQWNLKSATTSATLFSELILIESQWNLKMDAEGTLIHYEEILIESQWNLKLTCRVGDKNTSVY